MTLFRARDYYYCEHCQSYHFPHLDQDGLRILGENPEGIPCPHCQVVLNLITYSDFFKGYQCPICQGLLFNRTTFREAIDFRRSLAKIPPDPFSYYDPDELTRDTYCPVCQKKMETFQYNGPGNIVIDTCHENDLIWLDYGELSKVVNAPGRDRGVPRRKPVSKKGENRGEVEAQQDEPTLGELVIPLLEKIFSK
jgi:Zn-finger nucleic acid-binding protein